MTLERALLYQEDEVDKDGLIQEALRIDRAFIEAEELRQKAARDVTAFAAMLAEWYPDATQREIASMQNYLYWDTNLPYRDWPKAINFKRNTEWPKAGAKPSADPRVFEFWCSGCGCEFEAEATSRTARDKGQGVCPACQAERDSRSAERSAAWAEQAAARREYLESLRSMPYREYLQTEHWQQIRKAALKRAGYRCAVCNASGTTLDVHHRTYERRGNEYSSDVLALCRDCHTRFHVGEGGS